MIGDIGIGMGLLRSYGEAEALLNEASEVVGQWSPLFQAQFIGRQAQTALRASQPSLAAARIFALARTAPLVNSSRLDIRIAEIFKATERWSKVPEIRDAREHLESIMRPETADADTSGTRKHRGV